MCRWLAYTGSPVCADVLLFRSVHSLVDQSRHAQRSIYSVNGDGFGVGWFGDRPWPGVFRDTQPAWNDDNFRNLAWQVRSPMILAHVRATSGTAIQRTNCHPFRHKRWLFQHNGEINEFARVKRSLQMQIAPELFTDVLGSTDSETMFYLAVTFGLEEDPVRALARMVGAVETACEEHGVDNPLQMTAAVGDGRRLIAVRYSSDGRPPSLYHSRSLHALHEVGDKTEDLPEDGVLVLSEPLDDVSEHWEEIPASTALVAEAGEIGQSDFQPIR